jgi:hypothetical protein
MRAKLNVSREEVRIEELVVSGNNISVLDFM